VQDQLDCRSVVVRDGQGRPRIVLACNEAGAPRLAMHDHDGNVRVTLQLGPIGNPSCTLYAADGLPRVTLMYQDGGGYLQFTTADRTQPQPRAVVGVNDTGAPFFIALDREGRSWVPDFGGRSAPKGGGRKPRRKAARKPKAKRG
jgi:hypothetical protein